MWTCLRCGGLHPFIVHLCPTCGDIMVIAESMSAQPCGCDRGAKHLCERHAQEERDKLEEALRMSGLW